MSWIKIDDRLPEHPKFFAVKSKDAALTLYIKALCYSSRNLTDGVVPKAVLHEGRGKQNVCKEMVNVGLLQETSRSYVVKDYLEWNRSKEEVLAIREKRRKAGQAGGQASCLARAEQLLQAKANPDTDTERTKVKTLVQKPAKSAALDGFDEFWKEQTRKEGKGAARSAYAKALKTATSDVILAGWLRSRKAYAAEGRDRKHYPLPATWLNQERWDDDYSEPKKVTQW